jgi:hypothetical protein
LGEKANAKFEMGSAMRRARVKFGRPAALRVLDGIGRRIARYLEASDGGYDSPISSNATALRRSLQPGDVLLVEGNSHISGVIKYLTQSTWSHAALYVGTIPGATPEGEPHVLVEAELGQGVVSSRLSKYDRHHTRICRPIGLSRRDCERVCNYAVERIGFEYDFRNIIDLMRHLMPLPVPQWRRRQSIALGSGSPTRIICSALIAQAFETVRYPILPKIVRMENDVVRREMVQIRHSSLCAPRDFDISPYFQIVKPALMENFNYKCVDWIDLPATAPAVPRHELARNYQGVAGGALVTLERSESRAHAPFELGINDCRIRSYRMGATCGAENDHEA